jgi:site-specific DNA-methyltransferase (cytosine-N4-specific)
VILQGDAREMPFQDGSVQCVVTSPPYFGLRRSGEDPREIGVDSLRKYVEDMTEIGLEIHRVLADDGLFWLNMGDTSAGSGGSGGDYLKGGVKEGIPKWRQGETGLPALNLCLVPFQVASALQASGWLLRQVIVWDKGQTRRANIAHEKKPLDAHEFIFLFAKQRKYRQFMQALPERGTVWHMSPARGPRRHSAPFPIELPHRCILASTEIGDTVLDPFVGGGTTVEAAERLRRVGLGLDLYASPQNDKEMEDVHVDCEEVSRQDSGGVPAGVGIGQEGE